MFLPKEDDNDSDANNVMGASAADSTVTIEVGFQALTSRKWHGH